MDHKTAYMSYLARVQRNCENFFWGGGGGGGWVGGWRRRLTYGLTPVRQTAVAVFLWTSFPSLAFPFTMQ